MLFTNLDETIVSELATVIMSFSPLTIVTPTNAADEKKRWLKIADGGSWVDPAFVYDRKYLKEVSGHQEFLKKAKSHIFSNVIADSKIEQVIKNILIERIDSAICCCELAASILLGDDKETSNLSHIIYGHPSNSQVCTAYQIVSHEIERPTIASRFTAKEVKALKKIKLEADDIKYWFEEVLKIYGITNWKVEISDDHTAIDVRDKNPSGIPTVGIPTSRKVDGLKLIELAGHEINCHLVGSENCKALIEDILGADSPLAPLFPVIGKSDNELFYEGVAKISDVSINGSDALPLPYATIACDQARRGASFKEIARIIYAQRIEMGATHQKALEGAWTTTYRIMRGCNNTSKGGYCFSKDYIYFCGYSLAQGINPEWHSFASMTEKDLVGIMENINLKPKYERIDVVEALKERLLTD